MLETEAAAARLLLLLLLLLLFDTLWGRAPTERPSLPAHLIRHDPIERGAGWCEPCQAATCCSLT